MVVMEGASFFHSWAQAMVDFSEFMMRPCGHCLDLTGSRSHRDQRCQVLWDTCLPTYKATHVHELEIRRSSMALALAGQLLVIGFRAISGHVGSCLIGMVIFVVGNNARCSLQSSTITGYVITGLTFGVFDAVDLVKHLFGMGSAFLIFPFSSNITSNLPALSMLIAPVAEIGGARIAWDSYLQPSMLFQRPMDGSPGVASRLQDEMPLSPWWWNQFSPSAPLVYCDTAGHGSSSECSHGAAIDGSHLSPQKWALPRSPDPEQRWWVLPNNAASSGEKPWDSAVKTTFQETCAQCGDGIVGGDAWYGAGHHSAHLYCGRCWAYWASGSRTPFLTQPWAQRELPP